MQCGWYSDWHGSSNQRSIVCQTKCFLLPQQRHLVQRWTHQLPCQGHCTYLGPQHSPLTILLLPDSTQWERAQSPIQLQLHAMREQSHRGRADPPAQTLCAYLSWICREKTCCSRASNDMPWRHITTQQTQQDMTWKTCHRHLDIYVYAPGETSHRLKAVATLTIMSSMGKR